MGLALASNAIGHRSSSIESMPLLITYDLKDADYESVLLKYLSDNGAVMIAESSYLVTSGTPPAQVVSEIRKATKDQIVVYVLTLSGWAGFGPKARNDALTKALG